MALQVNGIVPSYPTEASPSAAGPAAWPGTARRALGGVGASGTEAYANTRFQTVLGNDLAVGREPAAARPSTGNPTAGGDDSAVPQVNASLSEFERLFGGRSYSPAGASSAVIPAGSNLSDFELTFGGSAYNRADPLAASRTAAAPAADAPATPAPPTAQSVFGPDVWMTDPAGLDPDGNTFGYNPIYFATQSTAQTVAQMVGGTVVAKDMMTNAGGPFVQLQPNYMVQMPNGALINPGLVASFYTFGFSQAQINCMIAQEVANTPPPAQTT